MLWFSFIRAPFGESNEPRANHQPELAGVIRGGQVALHVYGVQDCGLRREFHGKTLPFEGQKTFDGLRSRYRERVGSVFGTVDLQDAPRLHLEQTKDGWCVLRMGGAESPHFNGLIARAMAAGFGAKAVPGRAGFEAVAIEVAVGEELAAFKKLKPIIINAA
ncbi:MAG TPA: hypothetical protein VJ841_05550 [Candidatus Saccharimonadales bacterium]|nr:hypothetical protein [Candidatus Saccharimonadales bacterium]